MNTQLIINRVLRRHIHKLIVWYLKKCGGAFHSGKYGIEGKYVVLMNDNAYSDFQNKSNQ